jgi:DNA-binding transcriptional MerR regulator
MGAILGVHIQTLRKYEQDFGLLIPRDENRNRYYTEKERTVFETIIRLKGEGLGSKAINKMLGRSVDVTEQREKALEVISLDQFTGQDIQQLFKKALAETLIEHEIRLKKEFEEKFEALRQEQEKDMERYFTQQAIENDKLKVFLKEHRKEELEKLESDKVKLEAELKKAKGSFFSKFFKR